VLEEDDQHKTSGKWVEKINKAPGHEVEDNFFFQFVFFFFSYYY